MWVKFLNQSKGMGDHPPPLRFMKPSLVYSSVDSEVIYDLSIKAMGYV